ncbi:hypothetical protein [Paenibacillus sp. 481]|uniref:hypothetical protein n=1 Tax=Paenibacillus sp. 481 TaxID=2835869 RepID=UPI001E4FEC5C|nr:hypothetical protein [Paenibacillus sp. 481]UHA72331.1 hypothetical protein KIK04_16805 [Paenibacillus sp. 481]
MRKLGWLSQLFMLIVLASMLSGCNNADEADIKIFMMPKTTISSEIEEKLEQHLNKKLDGKFTVDVVTSVMYSPHKLFVEYAAGGNSIMMVPKEDMQKMSLQGGHVPLEPFFNKDTFREGYIDGAIQEQVGEKFIEKKGKHLFALPTSKLPVIAQVGIEEKDWFAAVHVGTPSIDKSVAVLKMLAAEQ